MRFKTESLLVYSAVTLLSCCGSARNTQPQSVKTMKTVGSVPEFYSSAFSASAIDSNYIIATDENSFMLNEFSLQPFKKTKSMQLPFDTKSQKVISDDKRKWFLVVSGADYAVMKENGEQTKNPVEVQGNISGIAVDGPSNTIVITDDFGSMALLQLSETGDVLGSWISGPLISVGKRISSATLVGSTFVAAVSESSTDTTSTLIVADIVESIKSSKWSTREIILPGPLNISWMAPITTRSNTLMARGSTSIVVIDIGDSGAGPVLDTVSLESKQVLGVFRDKEPHVLITEGPITTGPLQYASGSALADSVDVYYLGSSNKLERKTIGTYAGAVSQSWLETALDRITVLTSAFQNESYAIRYRLSDNLLTASVKLPKKEAQIALAPDHIFIQYNSALGHTERWGYGRNQPKEVMRNSGLTSLMNRQAK